MVVDFVDSKRGALLLPSYEKWELKGKDIWKKRTSSNKYYKRTHG